jgi:hypothetical protein
MSEQYWIMNGLVDRFQEFPDNWLGGDKKTTLIDPSKIDTVPMAFFIGSKDNVCPPTQADDHISQITASTTKISVEGEGHMYFSNSANTDWFMTNLIAQLQVPTQATEFLQ